MEKPLNWDIFCKVIDNFGDLGVCWRLSADLASRGHRVRLWVDDATALAWMAPQGHARVQVVPWVPDDAPTPVAAIAPDGAADVIVEGFACAPHPAYLKQWEAHLQARLNGPSPSSFGPPVWINLEYLSAQAYVARSHRLPSSAYDYPLLSEKRYFFFPGFTPGTGGLIREAHAQPGGHTPLKIKGQAGPDLELGALSATPAGTLRISLFCYASAPLGGLFQQVVALLARPPSGTAASSCKIQLLVTAGQSTQAVQDWLKDSSASPLHQQVHQLLSKGELVIEWLPYLCQNDFDALLRLCHLNFVRGEDSLVRALWAERPFVWQLYVQTQDAHQDKLEAFLDTMALPDSWCHWMRWWNADQSTPESATPMPPPLVWEEWTDATRTRVRKLREQGDLVAQLVQFVHEKR